MDTGLEDALAEQEAFLRSGKSPAAKVVKRRPEGSAKANGKAPKPPSAFKAAALKDSKELEAAPVLVGAVVEKLGGGTCKPMQVSVGLSKGFPVAKPRTRADDEASRPEPAPTTSILEKPTSSGVEPAHRGPTRQALHAENGTSLARDNLVDRDSGEVDMGEIASENLRRLAGMREEEVVEAQAEIMSMFSPEALDILRRMGEPRGSAVRPDVHVGGTHTFRVGEEGSGGKDNSSSEEDEEEEAAKRRRAELLSRKIDSDEALATAVEELLNEEERARLAWTEPVRAEGGAGAGADSDAVMRVDLEGRLVEGDVDRQSGLYHNAEQVAGYTLQHLCDTARSSDRRQRALALRVWSKLLRRPHSRAKAAQEGLPGELPLVLVAGLDDKHGAARAEARMALAALILDDEDEKESDISFDLIEGQVGLPPAVGAVSWPAQKRPRQSEAHGDNSEHADDDDGEPATNGGPSSLQESKPETSQQACRLLRQDAAVGLMRLGAIRRLVDFLAERSCRMVAWQQDGHGDEEVFDGAKEVWRLLAWAACRASDVGERLAGMEGFLDACEAGGIVSMDAEAMRCLRLVAQSSRKVCLEIGARGMLRASKGLLGLNAASPQLKLEVLRLWRVALSYDMDVESLLDVLAVMCGSKIVGSDAQGSQVRARLLPGLWVAWDERLVNALYRALDAACLASADWWEGSVKEDGVLKKGGVLLGSEVLQECRRRLTEMASVAVDELRGAEGREELQVDDCGRVHFVAGALEAGLLNWQAIGGDGLLEQLIDHATRSGLVEAVVRAKKRVMSSVALTQSDLLQLDFCYSLTRLCRRSLTSCPAAVGLLQRLLTSLDLVDAWLTLAKGQRPIEEHAVLRGHRLWYSGRLFVRLEAELLLANDQLKLVSPAAAEAQCRRLVPLCSPGDEEVAKCLILASGVKDHPALVRLYSKILADDATLSHVRALSDRRRPSAVTSLLLSPSLASPSSLLPLPPHWLLLPLASQPGTDHDLTHTLLSASLRLLATLNTYTSLLPPGLVLYHALCICLLPPDAVNHDAVMHDFFAVAKPALVSATQDLPVQLELGARLASGAAAPCEDSTEPSHGSSQMERGPGLEALMTDLIEALKDGSWSLPCGRWAAKLLVRRVWPASVRARVWRELREAALLRVLEGEDEGGECTLEGSHPDKDEPAGIYLDPPEEDADMLDEYVEALASGPLPLAHDRGALAWLTTVHHIAHHIFGRRGSKESDVARLLKVVRGAEPETIDAVVAHRYCTEREGPLHIQSVDGAVRRLMAVAARARKGQLEVMGDRERTCIAGVISRGGESQLREKCEWIWEDVVETQA